MTEGTETTDLEMEKAVSEANDKLDKLQQFCADKGINLVAVVSRQGLKGNSHVAFSGDVIDLVRMSLHLLKDVSGTY